VEQASESSSATLPEGGCQSMAAKKRVSRARKAKPKARPGNAKASSGQIARLAATVQNLRTRLVEEARRRKLDQRLLAEAKRARARVAQQISALRAQGAKLAKQLQRAARDANAREAARQAALAKITELRDELRRKREEVRRTSAELAKLARESAARARNIMQGGGLAAETPAESEPTSAAPQDGPVSEKPST
jgi:chromosome segregation ATPase